MVPSFEIEPTCITYDGSCWRPSPEWSACGATIARVGQLYLTLPGPTCDPYLHTWPVSTDRSFIAGKIVIGSLGRRFGNWS